MPARMLKASLLLAGIIALSNTAMANNYLDDANRLIAKGDLKAARIQLKNALQAEPQNMEAHYRLGSVYLELGDPVAAATEARTAQDGGYDADQSVVLLAQADLAQGKYRQILDEFHPDAGSAARRAAVLVVRGYAQIALNGREDAEKSFEEAQRLTPQSAAPLLAEARLLSSREPEAAAALFDRALALAPQSAEALVGKAKLLRGKGDIQGALELLDKGVEQNPQLLPVRLERAEVLLDLNKTTQAQADIDAVLANQPQSASAIYLRAILYAKARKFTEADTDLERISALLGRAPRGYYVLAVVKYNLRQLSQAEDAARRYAARYPDDAAGQKLLGRIQLELGHPAEAIDTLTALERSNSADPESLDLLGRADLQANKPEAAMTALEEAVKRAPDDASLRYWLGVSRLRTGDAAEAIKELTRSLTLAPSAPAGAVLVLTDIAAGDYDAATKAADSLRQAKPDSPVPDTLAGLVRLAQFDLDGARAIFAAVATKYPDFIPARLDLARVAELQGRSGEARQLFEKILHDQPGNGAALTRLVELLLRSGENDAAVAAAERAHAGAPDNRVITGGLIDLYLRLGQKTKALTLARAESGGNEARDIPLIGARARAEVANDLPSDAAQTYRRLIAIDKSGIEQRRQLAAVLLKAGDGAGAREAIDDAIKLSPTNSQLVEDRIAIDLKTDGLDAALASAKTEAAQHPGLPSAAGLEGDVYVGAGRFGEAAASYQKAYQSKPSALLAMRLYRVLSAAGKPKEAASALRDWLAGHPDDLAAAAQLGTADILSHRYDEARTELEAVVAKQPQNPIALNNLAWLYQLTGDPRAQPVAERAYALAPNVGEIAATLGWILTKKGHAADAVGLLQQASATEPASAAIKYHLAVALNDTGQHQAARQILSSLVTEKASFDDKSAAEQLLADLSKR